MPKPKRRMAHNPFSFIPKPPSKPPFLRSVDTDSERRIYTFYPESKKPFSIRVEFPIDEDAILSVEITNDPNIHALRAALEFVEENERSFIESFDESEMRRERREDKPEGKYTDESFLTFKKS